MSAPQYSSVPTCLSMARAAFDSLSSPLLWKVPQKRSYTPVQNNRPPDGISVRAIALGPGDNLKRSPSGALAGRDRSFTLPFGVAAADGRVW